VPKAGGGIRSETSHNRGLGVMGRQGASGGKRTFDRLAEHFLPGRVAAEKLGDALAG
jgi:hypothetical protein